MHFMLAFLVAASLVHGQDAEYKFVPRVVNDGQSGDFPTTELGACIGSDVVTHIADLHLGAGESKAVPAAERRHFPKNTVQSIRLWWAGGGEDYALVKRPQGDVVYVRLTDEQSADGKWMLSWTGHDIKIDGTYRKKVGSTYRSLVVDGGKVSYYTLPLERPTGELKPTWSSALRINNQHQGSYWADSAGDYKSTAELEFTGGTRASRVKVTDGDGKALTLPLVR